MGRSSAPSVTPASNVQCTTKIEPMQVEDKQKISSRFSAGRQLLFVVRLFLYLLLLLIISVFSGFGRCFCDHQSRQELGAKVVSDARATLGDNMHVHV
ncbi:hypothetical protein E2562_037316 [Oryza meyeriana var. granulata]|uniref:Uncharacterized protein n=1 Tax=Oryza meyeriana var. granulata TaxID=110450 RepID=A0A6G1CXH8_9ORYZ|nr:hypothetical protein E2562_037316 [Oryza meyeriana var. granulata]